MRNDSIPAAFRNLYEAACATCCMPLIGIALPTASDRDNIKTKKTSTSIITCKDYCDGPILNGGS